MVKPYISWKYSTTDFMVELSSTGNLKICKIVIWWNKYNYNKLQLLNFPQVKSEKKKKITQVLL